MSLLDCAETSVLKKCQIKVLYYKQNKQDCDQRQAVLMIFLKDVKYL